MTQNIWFGDSSINIRNHNLGKIARNILFIPPLCDPEYVLIFNHFLSLFNPFQSFLILPYLSDARGKYGTWLLTFPTNIVLIIMFFIWKCNLLFHLKCSSYTKLKLIASSLQIQFFQLLWSESNSFSEPLFWLLNLRLISQNLFYISGSFNIDLQRFLRPWMSLIYNLWLLSIFT